MKKLTIVFYENPAALAEIEFWEKTMSDEIETKRIIENDIVFNLKKGEILYCTPIDNPSIYTIEIFLKAEYAKYNKTLIFGKVEAKSLTNLLYFINRFENE